MLTRTDIRRADRPSFAPTEFTDSVRLAAYPDAGLVEVDVSHDGAGHMDVIVAVSHPMVHRGMSLGESDIDSDCWVSVCRRAGVI